MVVTLLCVLIGLWLIFQWQVYGLATALARITRKENRIMSLTEDLTAAVTRNTSAVGSVLEYLKSFPPGTVIEDVIAHLNENSAALETAIPANVQPSDTAAPTVIIP
jgi:hypothetical protein